MFGYVKYTDGFKAIVATYNKHPKLQPKNISSGHPPSHSLGGKIFQRPGSACERSAKLEDSKAELEGEVATYRTANLKMCFDKLLNQVFSQKEQSETPEQCEPAPWTPTHPNIPLQRASRMGRYILFPKWSLFIFAPQSHIGVYLLCIGYCTHFMFQIVVIHLQGEIPVRPEIWAKIKNNTRDSMFVKELAVAFWGTDTLGERSLTGKECPTTKTTRQPLTLQKLWGLKGMFLAALATCYTSHLLYFL
ncbi:BEN domain containing protein 5 [Dissostichus eleginoides]|uniref:BEN domain containing protein 5 n=1 Tax=Dissostichus eleginoides TaxID=100907 RepID=A0AAD9CQE3_DISEL|nr:BEN domain containing protein 5 [Dissostichus eleginoides]